jgi:hypothetical protein
MVAPAVPKADAPSARPARCRGRIENTDEKCPKLGMNLA